MNRTFRRLMPCLLLALALLPAAARAGTGTGNSPNYTAEASLTQGAPQALSAASGGTAVVATKNGLRLHLRERPSADANSLGLYYNGVKVRYTGSLSDTWVRVDIGGYTGYMQTSFLADINHSGSVTPNMPSGTVYNPPPTRYLNLREAPHANATVLAQLTTGTQVTILGEVSGRNPYYHIATPEKTGFVMASYVRIGGSAGGSTGGGASGTAYVATKNGLRLHLRTTPSTNASSRGLYYNGAAVTCLSSLDNEWVSVSVGGYTGYMKSEFLARTPGTVASRMPSGTVYNPPPTRYLNLRARPTKDAQSRRQLPTGTVVTVLGETGAWLHVQAGGETGFVMADYVRF